MPCKECDNGKYKWGDGECKYDTLQECEKAHDTYDIVELIVDENNEELAIDAISLVTSPAIETDFVYFNDSKTNLTFAKVNEEERLLVSPALIPYKQIYRYDANKDRNYYVYFTADTVRKAAEAYMKHQNTNNATLQHEEKVTGVHTVESWIVEDSKNDKSNLYGYELPKGTWFVSMRVNNDEVWERIKSGELKGLSIEGYFVDKMETLAKTDKKKKKKKKYAQVGEIDGFPVFDNIEDAVEVAKELGCEGYHEHELEGNTVYMPCSDHEILDTLATILEEDCGCFDTDLITPNPCQEGYEPIGHKIKDGRKVPNCVPIEAKKKTDLESYNDYPDSASNNACKVLKWIDEYGRDEVKGMTRTGLARANQLCAKENITRETISRMASFKRHEKNAEINPEYKSTPWKDKGYVAWLGWGGTSGVNWAIKKLEQIDRK